ncbi:phage baseplate protein [Yersinia ruckeri]|uniref:phage baseplate protein n=1 Tax=Yersinia ruckeri TaxID=29486 RepID=UPI0008FD3BA0|nr:phage baseplate protein [Yersinia ruckeri]MCW6525276.1 phage baseplate protein [Yersinia ruckeri]MCW6592938.1 phage baseplate protein [Yersinia ruckeri]MCW6605573.1 phage baseplate protein [Yersinia ruckeri]OIX43818.1 phage baseplate protein [Yersinia ruckeri]OJC86749.1 phage baseplate protein [Yersinia ruckeri]
MNDNSFTPSGAQASNAESFGYAFERLMAGLFFIEIVQVKGVRGGSPNLVVDVIPLVSRTDRSGSMIPNSIIYNIPVFRLQRGGSAIIMNPVIGDIGMIAVCDRDNSVARANLTQSVPGSSRTHSKSDALYLGGFLNGQPTQFIEFADGAINITSPNPVNITCSKANITAPDGVEMTTPLLHVTGNITADGNITDNAGTQAASLKELRDKYNSHDHDVVNVQGGSSTITSNATDNQV